MNNEQHVFFYKIYNISFYKMLSINHYILHPTWREDLKGCNLYKSKPLEYQTKRDYVQEGTIYRGLEGLQLSLRGLYIILGIDCSV